MTLIPNSFQVPNAFVDCLMVQLSGNATKCYLLVVRKTVGWGKESDRISISQFEKYTGVKDRKTIYKVIKELESFGLILSKKSSGLITEFWLNFDALDQCQKTPVPKNTSTKDWVKSSTKNPPPTKPNIQNSKEKKNKQKKSQQVFKKIDLSKLDQNIDANIAKQWLDHRIAKKAPIVNQATFDRQMRQAIKVSHQIINDLNLTANDVITESIDAGWQGIGQAKWLIKRLGANNAKRETTFERSEKRIRDHLQKRERLMGDNGPEISLPLGRADGVKLL